MAESLRVGIDRADDPNRYAAARTALNFVLYSPDATQQQKGEAAYNIATTYPSEADKATAVRWAQRAVDAGFVPAQELLRMLGVTP